MKEFVCTECAKGINGPFNYCYYKNTSSAFPANILKKLKCSHGYTDAKHNWRYVTGLLLEHIPHEGLGTNKVTTVLSQKQLKEEAKK